MRFSITSSILVPWNLLVPNIGELHGVGAPGMFDEVPTWSCPSVDSSHALDSSDVALSFALLSTWTFAVVSPKRFSDEWFVWSYVALISISRVWIALSIESTLSAAILIQDVLRLVEDSEVLS